MTRSFPSRLVFLVLLTFAFVAHSAHAQCVSLTTLGSPSTQNFDTLSNVVSSTTNNLTITGWFLTESGGGARDNEQYGVDTGASTTGDTYSYGVAATPSFNVTAATNATPIVITTASNTFLDGQQVTIAGVGGNTAANGTWTITRISATQFSLNGSAGNGAYTSGGTAASAGATDRALGQLRSGTLISTFGSCYTNNTGGTINSLAIAYNGEQWRIGNNTTARDDRMDFQYSLNATDLSTGTWTDVDPLDFTNPIKTAAAATALYGNANANRVALSNTIGTLSIANGATFWIRWVDIDATSSDDGLAVDDFSLTPQGVPPLPTLNINDVAQAETNAGTTTFTFTVSISGTSATPVTFDVATADGTINPATAGSDYVAAPASGPSGTIPAGTNTSTTVSITVNGDTTPESNETFFVNISNIVGATGGDVQGLGTINNDDSATLNINDVSQIEGEAGTTNFVFTVSLTQPAPPGGVSFDVSTANGPAPTATAGTDYTALVATPGSISQGNTSTTVTVVVNGDTDFEPSENFFVNVSNITNATPGDVQGQGTILTDDIGLSIGDVTQNELNSGTSVFTFTVSLTSPAEGPGVTFDIATADNSATAGSDYVAKSETGRTIAPGASSATFTVTVNGDATIEPNETFFVNVTNVTGAEVTDGQALGTITNDDFPTFTIADASIVEGNAGTQLLTFTVTLNPAAAGPVSVDYATADDSATVAGTDYAATSGTLNFAPGDLTKTFDVTVNGDLASEGNEQFFVNLSNAAGGAVISDNQALGVIRMDDPRSISAVDTSFPENFDTLPAALAATTPVGWTFVESGSSANPTYNIGTGTSTTGDTYNFGLTAATATITNASNATPIVVTASAHGFVTGQSVTIAGVTGNTAANGTWVVTVVSSSTFSLNGSAGNGAYTGGGTATSVGGTDRALGGLQSGSLIPTVGALFRNDTGTTITTLTIAYTGEEWRLGTTGRADRLDFQYSLDATSLTTGTWTDVDALDFNTPDTAGSTGNRIGNLAQFRTPIQTTITGLSIANGATFWIRYNDFNASGSDDGLAVDDFSIIANITGVVGINDVQIVEGNAGTQTLTFTVTRSDPAPVGGTTVNYTTADNTATTADNDYVLTSGTATIPQGQTTATIDVTINGDTNQETSETFFVNLSAPVNGTLIDSQGVGTILADDFTFTLISAVQGSGNQSPMNGATVTVGGIVTGIKQGGSGGFFVQEEPADYDSDPNTSEGIFVFTAGAIPAGVAIGNKVAVTGTVSEFPVSAIPHSTTELTGASVSLMNTGQPLPPAATITAADGAATTNLSQYERYEGMRVATTLEVTAPTGGNKDEANATGSSDGVFYGVVQGNPRAFREPGIPVMDVVPSEAACAACIPRFDRNPERIRVSSTSQPGATQLNVAVGQIVSNLVGPLDYGFFEYSILPEAATVPSVSGSSTFTAVPTPLASELTVSSFNLERFYDSTDDLSNGDAILTATAVNNRLNKASLAIRNVIRNPDVLAVVEMENLTILQALASKVNTDNGGSTNYVAYLQEGNDQGGIDVGFLVNANRVTVNSVTQIGKTTTFVDPSDNSVDILHDRPPLVLDATINRTDATPYNFIVIANHLRSLNGNEEDSATGIRVREKRRLQAEYVANYIQSRQVANPQERIITVGDFNAFQFNDGLVDTIDTIKGTPPPANEVVEPSSDLVNPNLTNLVDLVSASERYSYEFGGNLQVLDHAILTAPMLSTHTRTAFGHLDAGFPEIFRTDPNRPERVSDHDAIVAYFDLSPAGALEFSAANYDVGEATTTFNVTVNRTGGSAGAVSVTYTVAAGTATAGADFTAATGTLNFAAGETSKTFPVTIANDAIDEANQTIALSLSSPLGGATLGAQSTATITILDDDAAPTLTINDFSVTEGDSGSQVASFNVTLTGATELTVTVDATPANGTATAADWSGSTSNLSFAPGVTTQSASVNVNGDLTYENNDTVLMNLTNAVNATIADNQGVLTINNNDAMPTITINDLGFAEGNSGSHQESLTVTLTGATELTVTLNAALVPGTATPGAVDYNGPNVSLTFLPGVTTQNVQVNIFGDTTDEPDETVFVNLSNAVNATIADNQGVLTIIDDDGAPSLFITDLSVGEGNAGTSVVNMTVTLAGTSASTVTVDFATANGTATAGSDYTAASGTLTFPSGGSATQQVSITVNGDAVTEGNETVLVNLTNPANATISDNQGILTITNDDALPALIINDTSVAEGNSGTANGTLTVTLAGNTEQTVTVDYATANGTATAGSDYNAASGTLTFAPGNLTQTINVGVIGDSVTEPNETILVNLTNATNATVSDSQGVLTINNDDGAPTLSVGDVTLTEGNSGTKNFTFTVTLAGSTAQTVTVDYATANNTATAGSDYTAASGTLTFNPGTLTQQVTVLVTGDTLIEPSESFFVNLTNASNATITDNQGLGTITNDDGADLVLTTQLSPPQPVSGQTFTLTLTLTNNGPADATNVVLVEQLPAGFTLFSATASQGSCSGNPTITCTLGNILNGASATVTLSLRTTNAGTFNAQTTATANETDPTPVTSTTTPITVAPTAETPQIPTLSEWALFGLAMALAAFAALRLRA